MKTKFLCYAKFTATQFSRVIYRTSLVSVDQTTLTNAPAALSDEDFVTYLKTAINDSAMFPRTEGFELEESTATTLTTVVAGALASFVSGGRNRMKIAFSYDADSEEYNFIVTTSIQNVKSVTVVPVEFVSQV